MISTSLKILIIGVFLSVGTIASRAADVMVTLHSAPTTITEPTVRLGDVASIQGGSTSDRRAIEQLDLESLRDQNRCEITRKQIQMRMLLAGYQRGTFAVSGPETVTAHRSSPGQMRDQLEDLLEAEMGRQFGVSVDRISVRLASNPQLRSLENALAGGHSALRLHPRNEFPIGRTRLGVDIIDADGARITQSLDAEVGLEMNVAIASHPIARGTVIQPEMIRSVERLITERSEFANPDRMVGRTTGRYIQANSILLANHLVTIRSGTSQTVKYNDLIDVVIPIGGGEIRLKNARAMESGAIGETIEILNPQSNRRINASIVGPNLATITSNTVRR